MTLRVRILATTCAALVFPWTPVSAGQVDFDEVGKCMAMLLQNRHFSRPPFAKLSHRFLESYVKSLDPGKMYFTRQDIDRFEQSYGESLDDMLLKGESMKAASDISRTFVLRVSARVKEAERLLEKPAFDFAKDEALPATRKDAAWPRDEAQAMELWQQEVKEGLLEEMLRRESAEPGGTPSADDKSPAEKVMARYRRVLTDAEADSAPEKVASIFLSAVAQAFDPHSDYMNARDVELFNEDMRNEINGIGVTLQAEVDGSTLIRRVVRNSPADVQGHLQAGDHVLSIDPDGDGPREAVDTQHMSVSRVSELVRGHGGTPVGLSIGAASGGTRSIAILRGPVPVEESLASAQLIRIKDAGVERKLGLITLPSFYRDFEKDQTACSLDVEKLLLRLKGEGIDGLLIDLRGNGGGSLTEVQRMTGFFTNGSSPVVQEKDGLGKIAVLQSGTAAPLYSGPLVVLTDRGSASASEIFAAALQDHNRAVLVGSATTFGKGTVQVIEDLADKMPLFATRRGAGAVRLTVRKFYRPSGLSTQNQGVIPDIILPFPGDARDSGEADLDFALEQDRVAPAPAFQPLERKRLFIAELAGKSSARIAASADFTDLREDAQRMKQLIAANRVSLNLDERRKELAETSASTKQREEERRVRFAGMAAADADRLAIYPLSLADALSGAELRPAATTAGEPAPGKSSARSWPNDLDPQKREAMAVLGDLIVATSQAG